jgi:hypothetical protein
MFSAYTVRKVVPRLLIAAILIQLSWWILVEVIRINNDFAHGIEGLLYAPFGGYNKLNLGSFVQAGGNAGVFSGVAAGGAITALGVTVAVGSGSIVGILAMAVTAIAGLLIAIFTLILRRAVLIGLLVVAPMALVMWVLPGTERFWKLWWESFFKLLIMYPLILFVIAAGRIFAFVTASTPNQNQLFVFILIVIGVFGPLFMIPALLKAAGAAFSFFAGTLNSKNKGLFDVMRNVRQGQAEKNRAKFLAGDRFQRTNFGARAFNRVGAGFGVGKKGNFGIGGVGAQAIATMKETNADKFIKENERLAKLGVTNDDATAVLGLSGGTRRGAAEAAAQLRQHWIDGGEGEARATARAQNALNSAIGVGIDQRSSGAALNLMAQNKSRAIGAGHFELIDEGIQRLARGNTQLAQDAAYGFQYYSRGAGRVDLGGNWTGGEARRELLAARNSADPVVREQHMAAARRATFLDGVSRTSATDLVRGHTNTMEQAADIIRDDFASGDAGRMAQAGALLTEVQNNLNMANGGNRDVINQIVDDLHINTSGRDAEGRITDIDSQIVHRINAVRGVADDAPGAMTANDLRNRARVYSGQQHADPRRDAAPTPAAPAAP